MNRAVERRIWHLTNQYFGYMKETSEFVDPIIKNAITESFGDIVKDNELYQKIFQAFKGKIGKPKLRSNAFRLGYEICGGEDWKRIASSAAAMDVIDASFYSADDIFDQEVNDKKIIQDKYIVSHITESIASKLLFNGVSNLNLKSEDIIRIQQIWNKFIRDIYEGFYIDLNENKQSLGFYNRRIYAYNYWENYMKISAIMASADENKIYHISEAGKNIGMSYMMANDIMDLGKDYEDIKNGRWTLPNQFAFENLKEDDLDQFRMVFGNKNATLEQLSLVAQKMVNMGIVEKCQKYFSPCCERVLEHLEAFEESSQKRMLQYTICAPFRNRCYRELSNRFGHIKKVESPLVDKIKLELV